MRNLELLIKSVRARLIIVVALSALTGLLGTAWRTHQSHKHAAMDALYRKAFWGDEASLKDLVQLRGGYADALLKDLLFNDQSLADPTILANALDARHALSDAQLANMLDITKPGSLRHSAFLIFQRRGCNNDCMNGALRELHQIWSGVPTIEESRLRNLESDTILRQARSAAESESMAMVETNPCAALSLSNRYGPVFAVKIRNALRASDKCN